MNKVSDFKRLNLNNAFIVKKGAKYLIERNGELGLSVKQSEALMFTTEEILINFIDNVTIDTRNARVIGRKYDIVPISKRGNIS